MSSSVQIRLNKRPIGLPRDDVWEIAHEAPREPTTGEISVDVAYLSVDPAMRGWMNDARTYTSPVGIGEVMRAVGVGRVSATQSDQFEVGDAVLGLTGVQTTYTGTADGFMKVMPEVAPLPKFLGGLGMPGMTAYFGLLDVGQPEEGDTVLVSAAGGAVGSAVGQIAKTKGCRVIGIAGGQDKCNYVVNKYGFDECIDYKSQSLPEAIDSACPDGVNVYFDNVGGETLEAAMARIAMRGRVVVSGAVSQYNNSDAAGRTGLRNYLQVIVQRARIEGFVVTDYMSRFPEAMMGLLGWVSEGKLRLDEHVIEGIERFPEALRMLFSGVNTGKLMIKVN